MGKFDAKIYERDIYQDSVYSSWLKNSNERDVLERVFRDCRDWWCKDGLKILDIGCGTGSAAKRLFKILDEGKLGYSYTGIDPYEDQLKKFRTEFPDKRISLVRSSFEDFVPDKEYDLAILVHSLYYVDDLKGALKKICGMAKKSVVVHHGERGINEVHEAFRSEVKKGANIISTWRDVKKALDDAGIAYDLQIVETEVDVSSCRESGNHEGLNLIRFFLERTDLPDSLIVKVREWFKKRPEKMGQDVGYFFIGKK
jgi:SAM-dependent methyltransferase